LPDARACPGNSAARLAAAVAVPGAVLGVGAAVVAVAPVASAEFGLEEVHTVECDRRRLPARALHAALAVRARVAGISAAAARLLLVAVAGSVAHHVPVPAFRTRNSRRTVVTMCSTIARLYSC